MGLNLSKETEEESLEALNAKENELTVSQCRKRGQLFEDDEFPASDESLTYDASDAPGGVQWLRPHEIASRPQFISDGFSRHDVSQGGLGDCWILASLAGLAERPDLIGRIVLPNQSMSDDEGYCGAFRFLFRKFGREVDVIVDDRLPVRGGQLLYAQHIHQEFWVCLLEKALAKLNGCYQSLESGLIFEALSDMTGGICEEIDIANQESDAISDLWNKISRALRLKSVIGASTISNGTGDDTEMGNGLSFSHAYTVTSAAAVETKPSSGNSKWRQHKLLRIRNPWGSGEWQGSWSDQSGDWTPKLRQALGLVISDDGEFWMEVSEFAQYFSCVNLLHLSSEWQSLEFSGQWLAGETAGGQPCYSDTHFTNPSFEVDIADSATDSDNCASCLLSLEEPSQRHLPSDRRHYVAKAIFVYEAGTGGLLRYSRSVANSAPFTEARSHVCNFRLSPGRYRLVPCTFEPGQEAKFLLRIFTEA